MASYLEIRIASARRVSSEHQRLVLLQPSLCFTRMSRAHRTRSTRNRYLNSTNESGPSNLHVPNPATDQTLSLTSRLDGQSFAVAPLDVSWPRGVIAEDKSHLLTALFILRQIRRDDLP